MDDYSKLFSAQNAHQLQSVRLIHSADLRSIELHGIMTDNGQTSQCPEYILSPE